MYAVNRAAGGEPLAVGEPLFSLLLYAREGERRTLGTVSPTFGAVTELWRRAIVSGNRLIPDEKTLREAAGPCRAGASGAGGGFRAGAARRPEGAA